MNLDKVISRIKQRGSILVTVMVTTLAIMLLVSTLINHYAINEAQAVEESLARIRIYWAMMGHWNYVVSRSLKIVSTLLDTNEKNKFFTNFLMFEMTNFCAAASSCTDNSDPQIHQILRDELKGAANCAQDGDDYAHGWVYKDISDEYCFVIKNHFFTPLLSPMMALNLELSNVGNVPVLTNLKPDPNKRSRVLSLYTETLAIPPTIKLARVYRSVSLNP